MAQQLEVGHDRTAGISKQSLKHAEELLKRDEAKNITPAEIAKLNDDNEVYWGNVIVSRVEHEVELTDGGIVKNAGKVYRTQDAIVVLAGPGEYLPNGTFVACDFKPGDKVVITKHGGTNMELDGFDLLMLNMRQVYAGRKKKA
jgi:chaperonin GroES